MSVTGAELNLAEDVFKLQHLLDANLLRHREEVEELTGRGGGVGGWAAFSFSPRPTGTSACGLHPRVHPRTCACANGPSSWPNDTKVAAVTGTTVVNGLQPKQLVTGGDTPAGAAVKEEQIETKLASIQADWATINLVFADCKTRGPVILKGSDTADLIEKLEDSQAAGPVRP
eukprot:scaffold36544_cov19-Tisochrysis_lutea.AAC.8